MALTLASSHGVRYGDAWKFLLALPPLAILLAGCNDTCFSFTSNPPTGTINIKAGDPRQTCMFTKANGTVRVLAHAATPCSSCPPSTRVAHLFVSLRGIEIRAEAVAEDTASDWQELMPPLVGEPLQFDLMSTGASRGTRLQLGEGVIIPADTYRQLRLRLVPNQPTSDDPVPQSNACGATGFNCVVLEDGRIYPFRFGGASSEIAITSEAMADGFVLIPPDSDSNLVIELKAAWPFPSLSGERALPVLTGRASIERRPVEDSQGWKANSDFPTRWDRQ
jgi:hypothetical protein